MPQILLSLYYFPIFIRIPKQFQNILSWFKVNSCFDLFQNIFGFYMCTWILKAIQPYLKLSTKSCRCANSIALRPGRSVVSVCSINPNNAEISVRQLLIVLTHGVHYPDIYKSLRSPLE